MFLAVTGRVIKTFSDPTFGLMGQVDFAGVTKTINLSFVPEVKINQYVMVYIDLALSIVHNETAFSEGNTI
ncbi:MAG: HypC/HybG/HupF family hydrogenase formation chaperone [Pseudomonadota bacterium]